MKKERLAIRGGKPVRTKPYSKWPQFGVEERKGLLAVFDSGEWWYGKRVARFEREFAAFQGAKYGVSCTSGTVAIELALKALGLEAGDEVVVPAYTFIASATAVLEANAVPVFVDVTADSWNIDPARLDQAIGRKTRAIMPVHFAGIPADMDGVMRVAKRHGLAVIEDAAQAWGSRWRKRGAGTFGDAGAFSFQRSKNITAGEGGMLLSNNRGLAEKARSLANCGRLPGGKWYEHHLAGGNYRLTELQAAILSAQLKRFRAHEVRRRRNAAYLDKRLAKIEGIVLPRPAAGVSARTYHLYTFRYLKKLFGGLAKPDFVAAVRAEGIPLAEGYVLPLYRQPLFSGGKRCRRVSCPVAERLCADEGVWLHHSVLLGTRKDMDDVVRAILKVQRLAGR